nr:serine carboxypeptidase 24-like [Tanacetum cinerariifolium]
MSHDIYRSFIILEKVLISIVFTRPLVTVHQHPMDANYTGISYKCTACSGETDSVVPVSTTRFLLSHLNLTVKTQWYPWYINSQVGGWSEVFNGLTFATVRGSGEEVPLLQPQRGFLLFQSFLAGKCRLQVNKKCFPVSLNWIKIKH